MREASYFDLPALLALGARMHAESPHFNQIAFSETKLRETLMAVMGAPNGFLWIVGRDGKIAGVMVGIAMQHWCSIDMVASELALFVEQEHRGSLIAPRLIKRYLSWARSIGCKQITAGVSTGVKVDNTTAQDGRLEFKQYGTQLEATWDS